MSRMGRLQLTWWRLPLRARLPVSNQTGYPTDVNAMECCHQEGTHEETQVQHQPSQERDGRCATPVGSSLQVSCPLEQRIPEGVSARAYSTGEQHRKPQSGSVAHRTGSRCPSPSRSNDTDA